jgi:hypothetical protein
MTETVADLQAQLETLNAARASGVTTTSYEANGVRRLVTWKSDIEMRNAQWDLMQRIAALQTDEPRRRVLVATTKGFRRRRQGFGNWQASDAEKEMFERDQRKYEDG